MAPGAPGIAARWTSSAKSGIGNSIDAASEVSFTLSHGIVNEVYFPREDLACIRDTELIVTDGQDFFSEEKRHAQHETCTAEEGVPAYLLTNTCQQHRYRIVKEVVTDPLRDTLLQHVRFEALQGNTTDYHAYVLLAPHLGNRGGGNTAWLGDHKGVAMLFAERQGLALALACSVPWKKRSVGFVGASDGWQDLKQHKQMTWEYERAESGNVALIAELALGQGVEGMTIALGFGRNATEAGHHAWSSITEGFDNVRQHYVREWHTWQESLASLKSSDNTVGYLFRTSAAVLRMHESKRFPGAIVASLSIPWGFDKGDNDVGGYHVVWPRDLVEASGGLIALEARADALRVLNYLMVTQEADGHWAQNMWLEGIPYWQGIQLDQVALPILLMDLCRQHGVLTGGIAHRYWPTVRKAVRYLLQHGPFTQQDRWEEEPGYTPFTMATQVAALLAAADMAEENQEASVADYCRQTADGWNEAIDHLLYVTDTPLAQQLGVEGYYIRVNPSRIAASKLGQTQIKVKNLPDDRANVPATELVCVDALALVRFGLRAADDPRILNTIKVIDALLKVDTPTGPCWHRYNHDGYGEHEDGSPFNGTGIGRAWPLLTGERAHYEVAAGHLGEAKKLLKTMESFANHGLFSEQVWDTADIPEEDLYFGKHSGSAMPLVWAHAEYIKLCYSIKAKKVFDMPRHTQERYIRHISAAQYTVWRFDSPTAQVPFGKQLRLETFAPAKVRWSADGWNTPQEIATHDTGLGVYVADLPVKKSAKEPIRFTFYWTEAQRWEGKDFAVDVVAR